MPDLLEKGGEEVSLTLEEKEILAALQDDIPLTSRPFAALGKNLSLSDDEVIRIIRRLAERGILRKFGAILRHSQAGFTQNAMVVWAVPEHRVESAGAILASFPEVSHCYERTPPFEGRYNVFTMVHQKRMPIPDSVRKMAEAADLPDYQILTSETEYKKSSMAYFSTGLSGKDGEK
ncbi:DNA-binding transcriptional regulator, Lrp family [Syntrophus gentianae]|uniref:siroheme decarboxylase n=1 Tax=Syntrophus gentianae TaxID=43775 RepID=A0A1H7Z4G2_9BACT|nr:Lrp/AsnC family transcriptional regulator [Syntrophus gentianae]SEM53216.1 DNA-binding transcriptional regulator, Lrp family [Syntrophus gentianae]